jgi:hypothetical protein
MRALFIAIVTSILTVPAYGKYGGGTGEPNDPYRIATAEDLILLGESPEDYDKHFILTADIDLDPNLPGRKVFDRAMIAPIPAGEGGTAFVGVFDGNGHTIAHLTCAVTEASYASLFGHVGTHHEPGHVRNLTVAEPNIVIDGERALRAGALAAELVEGTITCCYVEHGTVQGQDCVGGLVGDRNVGGLVGSNQRRQLMVGKIHCCYSAGYRPLRGELAPVLVWVARCRRWVRQFVQ